MMTPPDLSQLLPFATAGLPGIGGSLRASLDAFVVEELPLYEPSGEGPHLYVRFTKENLTTREVKEGLERLFGLPSGSVGYAGLKDKAARTTQTVSIPVNVASPGMEEQMAQRITEALPIQVHWAKLHRNKLKVGHLLGNRFQIVVADIALPLPEALARAEAIAQELRRLGVPNYFGPQRFGGHGDNAQVGYELLIGKKRLRDQWLRRFLISGYQSYLSNRVLALRLQRGAYAQLLAGDIAKKHATGGIFDVEDLAAEQPRFEAQEISFTLPMFGTKMRRAHAEAAALEAEVEAETGITDAQWKAARIEGTRRIGRLLLPDLSVEPYSYSIGSADTHGDGSASHRPDAVERSAVQFSFTLPKGGFATSVLREFMKSDREPVVTQEVDTEL